MIIREAEIEDIKQMQLVRNSVRENVLSDPNRITYSDYEEYLFRRGKGWVCSVGGRVVGFSIVDLINNNVWALFVLPDFEGRGIGTKLHKAMLNWYFEQTKKVLWLSTDGVSRAAAFYIRAGWAQTEEVHGAEIKFEMSYEQWCTCRNDNNPK